MKIDSLKPLDVGSPGRPTAKAAPKATAESAGTSDVRLSSASTSLAAQDPEVNLARVQEIRQAIAEGRFEINASAIADRLISSARELVNSHRQA
jgi:negative regulator of flagellin synthesis FlgM